MNNQQFKITWSRHEHEPQRPNPDWPAGTFVDLSQKQRPVCVIDMPYPAPPQLGLYRIKCLKCGSYAHVPSAGRPDDPRTVKLACRQRQRDKLAALGFEIPKEHTR